MWIVLRTLPGLPVIRDLIVDMASFFHQYYSVMPYLINDTPPERERLRHLPEEPEPRVCVRPDQIQFPVLTTR